MARYDSVLGTIGNTPLVDVSELCPNPRVQVLVKLEGLNPAGSVKDRAAKSMIEEAEKNGSLVPGQRILESSSGNTAAGLAMIAKIKGYPFTAVVPENVSVERTKLLTRLRRRDHRFSGVRGVKRGHAPGAGPGPGAPRMVVLVPVRQPGQPEGSLRGYGA